MISSITRFGLHGLMKTKRPLTIIETPNAKQVFFENREIGMNIITELVSKGYKIG